MITINRIEWVNPRWANKPEAWVIQKLVSTSISGRLLINAPHNIAFFPNLRPAKASPRPLQSLYVSDYPLKSAENAVEGNLYLFRGSRTRILRIFIKNQNE